MNDRTGRALAALAGRALADLMYDPATKSWTDNIEAAREQVLRPYDVDLTVRVLASSASEAEAVALEPDEWQQTSVIEAREA